MAQPETTCIHICNRWHKRKDVMKNYLEYSADAAAT